MANKQPWQKTVEKLREAANRGETLSKPQQDALDANKNYKPKK